MPLVLDNTTYVRWILEPDDKLDAIEEAAQIAYFTAQAEAGGNAKKLADAQETWKEARRQRRDQGNKINVTYRLLRARDKAELEDSVRIGDDDGRTVRPGEMKMLSVKRAVVSWDYRAHPWTEAVCENLHTEAYENIYGWVSFGSMPPEQDEYGDPIPVLPGTPEERAPENRAERRAAAKQSKSKTPEVVATES